MPNYFIFPRRLLLLSPVALLSCEQNNLSEEDKALAHKFRGLRGGQLKVDAFGEKRGVNIFDEQGWLFFSRATVSAHNRSTRSYGAEFGVPKALRVEWRDKIVMEEDGALKRGLPDGSYYGGTVLGDYTVPIASRIPEELLVELRKNGGGFRLKIRIHDDGPLIGWDIERERGSAPDGSRHHQVGGDFREAYGVNIYKPHGKSIHYMEKGWYIHPKTGERIKTDF